MPSKPRYFTYSSMAFFPLLSIRCLYSGNWYYCRSRCPKRSSRGGSCSMGKKS
ncbi:hypothetical protein [Wolbachia endosymbiont (group B) of Gerris lacustris]|uniref:hypothetical protein n=1 Tax=Wolbachia endosymbiont (group B) of Gerris lacustris TaxID=3066159 RepID=UPI003342A4E6